MVRLNPQNVTNDRTIANPSTNDTIQKTDSKKSDSQTGIDLSQANAGDDMTGLQIEREEPTTTYTAEAEVYARAGRHAFGFGGEVTRSIGRSEITGGVSVYSNSHAQIRGEYDYTKPVSPSVAFTAGSSVSYTFGKKPSSSGTDNNFNPKHTIAPVEISDFNNPHSDNSHTKQTSRNINIPTAPIDSPSFGTWANSEGKRFENTDKNVSIDDWNKVTLSTQAGIEKNGSRYKLQGGLVGQVDIGTNGSTTFRAGAYAQGEYNLPHSVTIGAHFNTANKDGGITIRKTF